MVFPTLIWLTLAASNPTTVPQPVPLTTLTVTLAWDAVPGVVGYKIYEGPAPRTYTNWTDVGNVTNATISRPGGTNYFAATSYDANGVESDYSNEAILTPGVQVPLYGLLFNQGSTNGVTWVDLTPTPFLRLTNAQGGPWQWFRSRVELTTNWR